MKIQGVLFDLDGTLLDRDASIKQFVNLQYEKFSQHLSHIPIGIYTSKFIEYDACGFVWKDKVYQQLAEELEITSISWKTMLEDYLQSFRDCCVPFPNLINTLELLKEQQFSLGIVTNGRGKFQLDNIRALGIECFFNTIVVSELEGIKKPNLKIFERALERVGLSASDCIYVGDHPENDVKAAQNAGMIGVWKKDLVWGDFETEHIISDLTELLHIIKELNTGEKC